MRRPVIALLTLFSLSCSSTEDNAPSLAALDTVAAGSGFACGLAADHGAWCWGSSAFGHLATTAFDTAGPVHIGPDSLHFTQLAVGWNHTCGLTAAGTVWCWGLSDHGQLGNGVASIGAYSASPVQVPTIPAVVHVAAGRATTCVLTAAGATWCWGSNFKSIGGVAGDGDLLTPTAVHAGWTFRELRIGEYHGCGLASDSTVACWGWNAYGQLGQGTASASQTPTPIAIARSLKGIRLAALSNGACLIDQAQGLYCWGDGLLSGVSTERDSTGPGRVARIDNPAAASAVWAGDWMVAARPTVGATILLGIGPITGLSGIAVADLAIGQDGMCVETAEGHIYCRATGDASTPPRFGFEWTGVPAP